MIQPFQISALNARDAHTLTQIALGRQPGQLAVIHARLVNVYTGELLEDQTVVTHDRWIAYTGGFQAGTIGPATEVIDAAGKVVIPGLIDGHNHLANFCGISEFVRFAGQSGTTTVVTESFEPYAVAGYDGAVDFLDSLADQPIKIAATAPAMVSISPRLMGVDPDDLARLLAREDILGLGESYWQGVLQTPWRLLPAMRATLAAGKTLEGHSAGARNGKLAAYTALGISSCHEPITAEEALARLRLGMHVMAREGNVRRDLAAIAAIRDMGVELRRLTLVSDGVDPRSLVTDGYMERVVQKAIDYGFDPITAIQMATLNVAEHFGIDHLVGGLAPGRFADLVLIPEIDRIQPELVVSNGRVIAREGRTTVTPREHLFKPQSRQTIRLTEPMGAEDFAIRALRSDVTVEAAVIQMVTDLVTREEVLALPVRGGRIEAMPARDVLKVAAIDRRLTPGRCFTGLIKGFGLRAGAMASSAAWDTANLVVVGADDGDMALCINRIRELQGGLVVARGGAILAELALPVLGLMADLPMEAVAGRLKEIDAAAKELGCAFPDPILTLATLTGAAIPYCRICEEGLVDLKSGTIKGLIQSSK
ncbi:MAG: adenine deaminase [Desulfatitalea sp.]|nr:adenine deaminase [Desulfatitalea sp.]